MRADFIWFQPYVFCVALSAPQCLVFHHAILRQMLRRAKGAPCSFWWVSWEACCRRLRPGQVKRLEVLQSQCPGEGVAGVRGLGELGAARPWHEKSRFFVARKHQIVNANNVVLKQQRRFKEYERYGGSVVCSCACERTAFFWY